MRRRLAVLLCGTGVAVSSLAGCAGSSGGSPGGAGGTPGRVDYASLHGAVPSQHTAKPEFTLHDTSGHLFDLDAATGDKVTMLYFGYTHCPDQCPTSMADLAAALRRVPAAVANDVRVVFVTTDPWRDTPKRLRQWLDGFDHSFVGLTGTPGQIAGAETRVGMPISHRVPAKKGSKSGGYSVTHFAAVMAYGRDGRLATLYPSGVAPSDIAADLPVLEED